MKKALILAVAIVLVAGVAKAYDFSADSGNVFWVGENDNGRINFVDSEGADVLQSARTVIGASDPDGDNYMGLVVDEASGYAYMYSGDQGRGKYDQYLVDLSLETYTVATGVQAASFNHSNERPGGGDFYDGTFYRSQEDDDLKTLSYPGNVFTEITVGGNNGALGGGPGGVYEGVDDSGFPDLAINTADNEGAGVIWAVNHNDNAIGAYDLTTYAALITHIEGDNWYGSAIPQRCDTIVDGARGGDPLYLYLMRDGKNGDVFKVLKSDILDGTNTTPSWTQISGTGHNQFFFDIAQISDGSYRMFFGMHRDDTFNNDGAWATASQGTIWSTDMLGGDLQLVHEGVTMNNPDGSKMLAWYVSDAVVGNGEVIPEPAGLGLLGVALLAMRKRRS